MANRIVLPVAADDSDDIVVALETARVHEERGDEASARDWLRKAASHARKQGRPERAGELARAAARWESRPQERSTASGRFERKPDTEHVLGEGDDFSEDTIVDSVASLQKADQSSSKHVLPAGTPVIRDAVKGELPVHAAIRVAVKRSLGGGFEARPLGAQEAVGAGEEEALLVPLRAGAKFA